MKPHRRRQAGKISATLPQPHHFLEDLLGHPRARRVLAWATRPGPDGKCFFERFCENYDNPSLSGKERWKWRPANWLIGLALRWAKADPGQAKAKLFHHHPTVRALALTARSIARYGLSAPQRYSAPLFVVWNITQLCNLSCQHCYQNSGPRRASDEMTLEEKLRAVDEMGDNGVPFLAVAGGEPLACPDLWPALEHATRRGIHLTLATNGTLLTPENVARLKETGVKYIEVSIDSLNPEIHDAFRRKRGAWAASVQGIRNSVAAGVRTGMATCFTRDTWQQVDDVVNFAIDLGCQTFSHFNFIPVGRGRQMLEEDLTPGQREILIARLNRHLQESRITVVSTAPQFGRACIVYGNQDGLFATGHAGRGAGPKSMVLSRYLGGCGTGRCYCAIQPNGDVTPCVYISDIRVGNLRSGRLADIWDNHLFAVLSDRTDRGDHCAVCDYRRYCGGCRARAYAYTGDITAGDPGCVYNYQQWNDLAEAAESPFRVLAGEG